MSRNWPSFRAEGPASAVPAAGRQGSFLSQGPRDQAGGGGQQPDRCPVPWVLQSCFSGGFLPCRLVSQELKRELEGGLP